MNEPVNKPAAVKGVIDLTGYSFSSQKTVKLDGEWEFYWKLLLSPEDIDSETAPVKKQYAPVPAIWSDLAAEGINADPKGYATYRLKIRVSDRSAMYGIRVFSLMSAYKIWADGKLIAEAGTVAMTDDAMKHRWIPGEYYFQLPSGEADIVVQISNFRTDLGGFWTPVDFGYAETIASMRRMKISFDNFLIGILMILAIYHIGFYTFQRKERSSLCFGLFCVIMAFRNLSRGAENAVSDSRAFLGSLLPY